MYRLIVFTLLVIVLLTACSPSHQPTATEIPTMPVEPTQAVDSAAPLDTMPAMFDWLPHPGDDQLVKDSLTITTAEITNPGDSPYQFALHLTGEKPTPCHQLRIIHGMPNERGEIQVEAYSLVNPGEACASVISSFDATVPLEAPAGKYNVLANGKLVGEVVFAEPDAG